jgi:hypothetical protein
VSSDESFNLFGEMSGNCPSPGSADSLSIVGLASNVGELQRLCVCDIIAPIACYTELDKNYLQIRKERKTIKE